jgi:hypothetical protein
MWADHLVSCYLPDREKDARYIAPPLDLPPWIGTPELEHPWPFDESWIKARDPKAARILSDLTARAWLVGQDNLT